MFDDIVKQKYTQWLIDEEIHKNQPLIAMAGRIHDQLLTIAREGTDTKLDIRIDKGVITLDGRQYMITNDEDGEYLYGVKTCKKCGSALSNVRIDDLESLHGFITTDKVSLCRKCDRKHFGLSWLRKWWGQ